MLIEPYLFFNGRCEEALEFYKQALGAEVVFMMRFKDSPDKSTPILPGTEEKVMHCNMKIGDQMVMASDGECSGSAKFDGFSLSLSVNTADEANKLFNALTADGGQVRMPLTQTFFSEAFGMCADKFGVGWMVMVYKPEEQPA